MYNSQEEYFLAHYAAWEGTGMVHVKPVAGFAKQNRIWQTVLFVLCVVTILSACMMEPTEKEAAAYIEAFQFVRSWNALAEQPDNLTGGVKISPALGRHTFRLGKDARLHYCVEKAGILHRKITFILYENPRLSKSAARAAAIQMASLLSEKQDNIEIFAHAFGRQKIQGLLFIYNAVDCTVQIIPLYIKILFSNCT